MACDIFTNDDERVCHVHSKAKKSGAVARSVHDAELHTSCARWGARRPGYEPGCSMKRIPKAAMPIVEYIKC